MTLEEFRAKYNWLGLTKMIQQYLDIKFSYIDTIVLFRIGDFYEIFFDDAEIASNILNITLTKKPNQSGLNIPMCGIPCNSLDNYLPKLIESNLKITLCDQLETPEEAKKSRGSKALLSRGVTRIITPGTLVEDSILHLYSPHYLSSLVLKKNLAAICYVDISFGEIFSILIDQKELINEFSRIKPKELLLSEKYRGTTLVDNINENFETYISYQVDSFFAYEKCSKSILNFYKIHSLKAIADLNDIRVVSIGSILEYLSITQKNNIPKLPLPKILNTKNFMLIDSATRRNLEITHNFLGENKGSIFSAINYTVTLYGARLLYTFLSSPLIDIDEINARYNNVDFFYSNTFILNSIRTILKEETVDLNRCLSKIVMNRASGIELLKIKNTLFATKKILNIFNEIKIIPEFIQSLILPINNYDLSSAYLINDSINTNSPVDFNDTGTIKKSYDSEIDYLYKLIDKNKNSLERLKNQYRMDTKIENLRICENNIIGMFVEVSIKNSEKINNNDIFIYRQKTSNSFRYTTLELQKLEIALIENKSNLIKAELKIYKIICNKLLEESASLKAIAQCLSELDVFCSFAFLAKKSKYVRPLLTKSLDFQVIEGRNILVENSLSKSGNAFITNDCILSNDNRIWLITGPNMSGKSTFLRQNAIFSILAQIGSFVPAKSAKLGIVDKIFTRIGSADDLQSGHSTFMLEMLETSSILSQSSFRSLIILDEVGRGTSTYDGISIAWSVLEYINNIIKCRCLFATHYHELSILSNSVAEITNYTVDIEEVDKKILFLYKIKPGAASKSYGIHVASLAGLPKSIISKAEKILLFLEENNTSTIKNNLQKSFTINNSILDEYKQRYNSLLSELCLNELDHLSPKEALDLLYKIKNHL